MANDILKQVEGLLTKQGIGTDFESKKRLFEKLKLPGGDFRGTPIQNTNFLAALGGNLPGRVPDPNVKSPLGAPSTMQDIIAGARSESAVPQQFKNMGGIPNEPNLGPQDILSRVLNQPGMQLNQAQSALQKFGIQTQATQAEESLDKELGYKGAAFSGERTVREKRLKEAQVAQELGVDISIARTIVSAMEQQQTADQKAKTDEAKAYDSFLATQGMSRNPRTGEIMTTVKYEADLKAEKRAAEEEAEQDLKDKTAQESKLRQEERDVERLRIAQQGANKPIEIDTFTDVEGNRTTVFMNPETGELESVVIGQAKDTTSRLKDRFLTFTEAERLGVPVGTRLSEVQGADIPEKEPKSPTTAENRQLAVNAGLRFEDKVGGWGVPEEFKDEFPGKDKISDSEFKLWLVRRYGITITDAKNIEDTLEKKN